MQCLEERRVECPYCGAGFTCLLDCSAGNQQYIEDCQVCCQPIVFDLFITDGEAAVRLRREDEA